MAGSNISSDPAALAAASRCLDSCIPPGAQKAVQTYLWAQIAGITDPAVILTNARCFMSCVPPGGQLTLQAYLTAVLAGGSTDPSTLANAARCFNSCIPPGANGAVITYSLANKAGGSTDPSTLASAARCFSSCIPLGFQLAAQNYLIAVAAGLSTDPQVLLSSAGFACFNCNITPGLAGSLIAQSVVTYTVGSLPPCSIPTGLTAAWNATGHPASGTVDVSWGAVPAGVSNTEVWFSFDDFTFVLADVVAAPGTTSHTGVIVFDPYVKIRFTINSPATTCSFTPAILASAPPPAPPVPTGLAAVWTGTTAVSWDPVPAGAGYTEVWSSTDNITFVLSDTVNFPGTTSTLSGSCAAPYVKIRFGTGAFTSSTLATSGTNAKTAAWVARVVVNGAAAPAAGTQTAINSLYNSLDGGGLTSKILSMALFVPDSLIAAITPLFVGTSDPWLNVNFVGGDLGANGLTGDGATKYLNPWFTPAFDSPQWTLTSCCLFFYAYTANSTVLGTEIGCTDTLNDGAFVSNFNFAGLTTFSDLQGSGARLSVATPGNGFYMASRIAAGDNKIYFANSITAWSAIASNAIGSSGLSTAGFLVYAFNNNATPAQPANSTLSCAGIAAGLTTTEGQCLYNAVQACRVALAGGFR